MKHIILNNGTTIRSEGQAAAEFITVHADNEKTKSDLGILKTFIKDNAAFAWAIHGITLELKSGTSYFSQDAAKKLLREKGATEEEIDALTIKGTTKRVSLAK
jgi:hypothetical protein